jgi:hypothetical protein
MRQARRRSLGPIRFEINTEIEIKHNIASNPEAEAEWEGEEIPVRLTVVGRLGTVDSWDYPGDEAEFALELVEIGEVVSCLHCSGTGKVKASSEWVVCHVCKGSRWTTRYRKAGQRQDDVQLVALVDDWMESASGEIALNDALNNALED